MSRPNGLSTFSVFFFFFFFLGGGEGGCTQASLEDVFIICVKEISSVYVIVFKSSSLGYSFK